MNFEIVLATNNKHKLQEVRKILSPHKITVYCPNDLNLTVPEVEENGKTYFENALVKAKAVASVTSFPVIADDSGLEIEALNNEPGLHSARYAESLGGHQNAFKDIFKRLEGKPRDARFICCIVLLNVTDKPLQFEGIAKGKILEEAHGLSGFGYDPIFFSEEAQMTFAELPEDIKNKVSHRGKALKKLLTFLKINHSIK